jgi:hypothetical protein
MTFCARYGSALPSEILGQILDVIAVNAEFSGLHVWERITPVNLLPHSYRPLDAFGTGIHGFEGNYVR